MRQKSKDIVALLSDEERLSEARRTKALPLNRQGSPSPLTLDDKWESKSSRPALSRQNSRRSFEHLQDLPEDEAMSLALAESRKDYEKREKVRSDKDEIYPKFFSNLSQSSLSSNVSTAETAKKSRSGSLQAKTSQNLLDMDDDSFSAELDSTLSVRENHQTRNSYPGITVNGEPFLHSSQRQTAFGHLMYHAQAPISTGYMASNPAADRTAIPPRLDRHFSVDAGLSRSLGDSRERLNRDPFNDLSLERISVPQSPTQLSHAVHKNEASHFSNAAIDMNNGAAASNSSMFVNPFLHLDNENDESRSAETADVYIPIPKDRSSAMIHAENIGAKPVQPGTLNPHFSSLSRVQEGPSAALYYSDPQAVLSNAKPFIRVMPPSNEDPQKP